ncbi:DUF115 domain-containing protein [Bacillus oleronius]|nr:DUF115 domain-containing protein [Heyndrickxia oleronia]
MALKNLLKSNKFIYLFISLIRKFQYFVFPLMHFNLKKFLRVHRFYKNDSYEKLKKLKNKHIGERCFIVATGPSLTILDLEKLKNEITFSMNSILLAFDETDWRPTYYGIQDENVYRCLKKEIEQLNVECKFISDTILKKLDIQLSTNDYSFPLNMLNHTIPHKKYHTKFSNDIFSVVYDGYTITYALLQIAVYMGFREIYLLGTDCHYSSNMKHHFKDYGHVDPTFASAGEMMISAYQEAKRYADNNKVKIFNATRGGELEVFDRIDLDIALATNN